MISEKAWERTDNENLDLGSRSLRRVRRRGQRMSLSSLSIHRPVLATVVNLLIVVLGLAAWLYLPVREYPDVDMPVVSITTTYLGASPETVEDTITGAHRTVAGWYRRHSLDHFDERV